MKLLLVTIAVLLVSGAQGDVKTEALEAHAAWRKIHGVEPLTWDSKLAKFAEHWCKHLAHHNLFEHSKGSGYGENLDKVTGGSFEHYPGKVTGAVNAWYREIKDYDYNHPKFSDKTGHFTQVSFIFSISSYL